MSIFIAAILALMSPTEIPVGKPRIAMPDLVRSWSWLDQSMAGRDLELEERRDLSRRLDDVTMLFFRNDIGGVARLMDGLSLEMALQERKEEVHRIAAALLIKLQDTQDGPSLKARWRYEPPSLAEPVSMTLVMNPTSGESHEVALRIIPGQEGYSIELDDSHLASLPPTATMDVSLRLADGTVVPQGRWERTAEPFSVSRTQLLSELEAIDTSEAHEVFRSRAARLIDRLPPMDITGHVLDRNQLRTELAEELDVIARGEDPYVNRPGDTWYEVTSGSTRMPVRLYVPEKVIEQGRPVPLLIALHGAGGNEHFFMDGCGDGVIAELAERHGFIVVSPSTYVMGSSMKPLETLVSVLSSRYAIDQDRIYLLGHSLGGMTAMGLASARPEMIDGIVAIAGGAPFPKKTEFPPVLAYAAERDFIVSGDMIESSAQAAKAAGAPVTPRRPDGTGHLTIVIDVLPESVRWLMDLPHDGSAGSP